VITYLGKGIAKMWSRCRFSFSR